MSNSMVGTIYSQIIEDVLNTSRVDFEEGGVEEGILEELKKVITTRLFPSLPFALPLPKPRRAALLCAEHETQVFARGRKCLRNHRCSRDVAMAMSMTNVCLVRCCLDA